MGKMQKILLSILAVSTFVFVGCGIDNTEENAVGANLVSAEIIDDINDSVMLSIIRGEVPGVDPIDENATFAFGYRAVKIVYKTEDTDGNEIDASGLLVVPQPSQAFLAYMESLGKTYTISTIIDNHETIFLDDEAPTNVEVTDGEPNYDTAVAITSYVGFAAVIPDYVGYGTSKGKTHPYIMKKSARASLDMLRASMRYMNDNGYLVNGQVYITGYSEGGYVAMALAQEIEQNYSDEFTIKALAPMAGPYDVEALGNYELNATKLMVYPAFLAYLAGSYSKVYDINISTIVQKPTVFETIDLFGGDYSNVAIHTYLGLVDTANGDYGFYSHTENELFLDSFIDDYHNNLNNPMRVRFEENSVSKWIPKTKVNLIHCVNDEIIPYLLSTKPTYEYMKSQDVDVVTTDLNVSAPSGSFVHAECGSSAYKTAIGWFDAIRSGEIQ